MLYLERCERCDGWGDGCPVCHGLGKVKVWRSAFHERRNRRGHFRAMGRAVAFLRGLGLPVREGPAPPGCFFPGVWYEAGGLAYDPRVAYVGDLMHDAGHLAILPARLRAVLGVGSVFAPAVRAEREAIARELDAAVEAGGDHPLYYVLRTKEAEESGASAWSLAACRAARVEPWRVFDAVTFYTPGTLGPVRGAGAELVAAMLARKHSGVLALADTGLCEVAHYPTMIRWLA